MATQIRLGPAQLAELRVLRDLSTERVTAVIEKIEQCDPPPLTSAELGSIFREVFGDDSETADSLLSQVISLASLERQRNLTADDVLNGLLYGIRTSEHPWTEDEVKRWHGIEPELRRLLEHPRVWRVAKALDLSYDFAHLLQEARIVSDIRPIFDRDATQLEAAVVSFTLRLRYDSINGNHGISIAMNHADIESLRDECDRALRKARIASDAMNNKAQVRTIITGSDDATGSEPDVSR